MTDDHQTSEFKPCPICGAELSWDDVRYYEVEEVCGFNGKYLYPDPYSIVICCDCGYRIFIDVESLPPGDRWRQAFVERVNRRHQS